MRTAVISYNNIPAGTFKEIEMGRKYLFLYFESYKGPPVSLSIPLDKLEYEFDHFPAFLEGLLPEGIQLYALLKKYKIDSNDLFQQLLIVGDDLIGCLTVKGKE